MLKNKIQIAILGGGPSGLFMFKRLIELGRTDIHIDIFEKRKQLGAGMPYSVEGAGNEHVTNVSGNEIPELVTSIADWIKTAPAAILKPYSIDLENFNDYKVLPRLLFGQYLSAQFELLKQQADEKGISYRIQQDATVTDIIDQPNTGTVIIELNKSSQVTYDKVIICTGHKWPKVHEGIIPNYFDSPYPPAKLALKLNYPVGIKGASLTAVDAIRTLARHNGTYHKQANGKLVYQLADDSKGFKMVLHSRNGMLPAVRFHLEDSHLQNDKLLMPEEIDAHIIANGGYLSLDYIFEKDFKAIFKDKQPEFYSRIKDMQMEEFVDLMMSLREQADPFELLKAEYAQAAESIKRQESIYWKEMLGVLSFAMNYPAKHLSAEDMLRLQKTLMPLIALVIAYVPQSSCEEIMALHDAGLLSLVDVGNDSSVEPQKLGGATYFYEDKTTKHFDLFIDCTGQPHLSFEDFPFQGLIVNKTISPARLQFRSVVEAEKAIAAGNKQVEQDKDGQYCLRVQGITINDNFQIVDEAGVANERIYIMAVPYIGGYNPDYSGLDFCEAASKIVKEKIFNY